MEIDAELNAKLIELNSILKIAGAKCSYRISRRKGTQEDKIQTLPFVVELVKAGNEIVRIWKMQPAAIWETYKTFGGYDNHRECVLLKQATELFFKYMRQCHDQLMTCISRVPDGQDRKQQQTVVHKGSDHSKAGTVQSTD